MAIPAISTMDMNFLRQPENLLTLNLWSLLVASVCWDACLVSRQPVSLVIVKSFRAHVWCVVHSSDLTDDCTSLTVSVYHHDVIRKSRCCMLLTCRLDLRDVWVGAGASETFKMCCTLDIGPGASLLMVAWCHVMLLFYLQLHTRLWRTLKCIFSSRSTSWLLAICMYLFWFNSLSNFLTLLFHFHR